MVEKWKIACVVSCAVLVAMSLATEAREAQGLPIDVLAVSKMAQTTEDPVRLKWAVETLLLHGTPEALEEVQRLLTDDGRLQLIDGGKNEPVEDAKLFGLLRFAIENLDSERVCALLVALSECSEYQPDAYEMRFWPQPRPGFSGQRYDALRRRFDSLMTAMGYLTEPTAEVLACLGKSMPYESYPVLPHDSVIRALVRIGTDEAFAILLDSRYLGAAATAAAEFRDRPETFRFLVDVYIRLGNAEASQYHLHRTILAHIIHDALRRAPEGKVSEANGV